MLLNLTSFSTVLFLCVCFHKALPQTDKGYYTIVAPGTVRSNSKYHFSITLDDFDQSCWFNITINVSEVSIVETVEVEPGSTKLVKLQMPTLRDGSGELVVEGFRGIITRDSKLINVEERHYTVFIQTSKAKYKPGELVQFRVICIDRLTRPAKVKENIVVLIHDGGYNLIKQFANVKLVQGVFKGDLQLSTYPVLGEWTIEVKSDGLSMQEKSFKVESYKLPRFSVAITTKDKIVIDDGQIAMTVKASYTYGEPVKGNLSINLKNIYNALGNLHHKFEKTTQIDGETTVNLGFKSDLQLDTDLSDRYSILLYTFDVEAVMKDPLTNHVSQTKTTIHVFSYPYKIQITAPKSFDPDRLVNITVSVKDLEDNPIRNGNDSVLITIENNEGPPREPETINKQEAYLNMNGIAVVSFNLTNAKPSFFKVKAEYLGWSSHKVEMKKYSKDGLNLDTLTPRPEVGKEVVFQLKSYDPIGFFVYEIVSQGNIIESKRIIVPGNETTYLLKIIATYSMVPKITLLIHRIKDEQYVSKLKEVYVKPVFRNSIKINTEKEVKPGASVSVNITTDEGSYVGLLGIDQKLLIDSEGNDDLTEDHVFTELHNYDSLNIDLSSFDLQTGLLIITNYLEFYYATTYASFDVEVTAIPAEPELPAKFDKPSFQLPRIRNLFSESWIFNDFERTSKEGLKLRETVPDTITSWVITGFSLNPNTGLALTKNATKLKVFQAFFIQMDLPNLVKDGEIVEIPIYIFNYMEEDLMTDVIINKHSEDLELLDNLNSKAEMSSNQSIATSIPAKGRVKIKFLIRARKPGRYNLTVTALSPLASDAVQKTLTVESEGIPYSMTKTYLIHFPQQQEQEDEISVEIPDNVVPRSEDVHLSVIGDLFGPLMKSLYKLVRVPFGFGERNMRYFVSNLLVLKYLKALNHSNPSLESKTRLHLELGYQTQLSFKQLDGSFSLFDRTSERTGDIWLTAFVMWGLQHAKDLIQMDIQVIERGLSYLKSKQKEDGSYSSGKGHDEDVSLTALTLLAFLVDEKHQKRYKEVISKGLMYMYEALDDLEHLTSVAMSTYVLVLGKHEKSGDFLSNLSAHASLRSKQKLWTKPDTLQAHLETTAANFMSVLESQKNPVQTILPIVRTLISTEPESKTPTHMIALEAMIKFARDFDVGRKSLDINFVDDQGVSGNLHVNSTNAQVSQTVKLKRTSRKIRLQTKGNGFAIVNVNYRYNLLPQNQSLSNYHTYVTVKESTESVLSLEVCVATQSLGSQSNLTQMEVNFPSGYTVNEKAFEEVLKVNEHVESIRSPGQNEGSVLIYLKDIGINGTCLPVVALKMFNVFNAKPVSVVVYDIYKEAEKTASFYEIDFKMNPVNNDTNR